ncbi:MAG: hypothetical protein QW587_03710 [Candidatus Bathyarchaeia archaeon]
MEELGEPPLLCSGAPSQVLVHPGVAVVEPVEAQPATDLAQVAVLAEAGGERSSNASARPLRYWSILSMRLLHSPP